MHLCLAKGILKAELFFVLSILQICRFYIFLVQIVKYHFTIHEKNTDERNNLTIIKYTNNTQYNL